MPSRFPPNEVQALLVACHRRCCVCHRFCGVKIETDHIVPRGEDGPDTIDNAIPVCFECHAEIHSYNDQHPRGRKFRPDELRMHKEQWLRICSNTPEVLLKAVRDADVGPLQALIDELDFNRTVAQTASPATWGCMFQTDQFKRAIQEGAIATLQDDLKTVILEAYVAMGRSNQYLLAEVNQSAMDRSSGGHSSRALHAFKDTVPTINPALEQLLQFLSSE